MTWTIRITNQAYAKLQKMKQAEVRKRIEKDDWEPVTMSWIIDRLLEDY